MSEHTKATAADADVLNNTPQVLTLTTGEEVTIHKCKVKQIGIVLNFLAYLMKSIGMKDLNDKPAVDLTDTTEIMTLIVNGTPQIYPVSVSLCSLNMEQFEDLEIDDAMAIMMAQWELNQAFFLQKILPMLNRKQTVTPPTSRVSKRKKGTRKRKAT